MKIFLFYINAIVGLDDWVDRKLIFPVLSLVESVDKLELVVATDEPINFRKLVPSKAYALQFEYSETNSKELKYYTLQAFEITPPPRGVEEYQLTLHIKRIEV